MQHDKGVIVSLAVGLGNGEGDIADATTAQKWIWGKPREVGNPTVVGNATRCGDYLRNRVTYT